ncbi:MAG: hypothetical protein O7B79_03780 [SAR324 cluster bacterium]|nr:hypothetical protein [SAR324 cluster bacterium]
MNPSKHSFSLPGELLRIGETIGQAGGRPVLVGGWVRDYLLGQPRGKDFDLEVFGLETGSLSKLLKKFGPVHEVGRHFGVLKLVTPAAEYDVSVPRRERKTGKGHTGFQVHTDPTMSFEEAAARRDFTINAMGYALLEQAFLDPFGGEEHLNQRILQHVGAAFGEDPLRVMRAMQFAGRFGLTIASETLAVCREQPLGELPRERMCEEFKKLLLRSPAPSHGLAYAEPLGVLKAFPELAALFKLPAEAGRTLSPWNVTLAAVDQAAILRGAGEREALVFMLAALCHGFSQLAAESGGGAAADPAAPVMMFLQRLTNETAVLDGVMALVREWDQPGQLYRKRGAQTDGKLRRLALRVSMPLLERLARAVYYASTPGTAAETDYPAGDWLLEKAQALGVLSGPPEPILKGRHLQEEGFPSGPAMGMLLKQAFQLQLDGSLATLEEALRWARKQVAAISSGGDALPGES